MGTDFSKVRRNPLKDYSGVALKQGAVLLDADANEGADIVDRRLRALAGDLGGRVSVSETTPDAFEIKAVAGSLKIGIGRLYVDGLLAECHGGDPKVLADRRFDSVLAERSFDNPIFYSKQPYLPQPPALPGSGRHLVYLDVWNREVTHLEQPDLVEVAVGVEASSRIQTVWQVRVLGPNLGSGATCASPDGDLPEWLDLIAPSTGRLTVGTYEVAPSDNPCELPPTGGYLGLTNQLYRVEIHDPSTDPGGATFKWSCENASVGSRVASIVSGTELELQSLGRDDVLSFKTGNWVEIVDDFGELAPPPGGRFAVPPGVIRKITVDAARRRITFAPALPAGMLPSAATLPNSDFPKERNMSVVRWDQGGVVNRTNSGGTPLQVPIQNLDAVGSTGVINVPSPATTVILEHGVTVQFDPGTDGFHTGDYWVFAARTADASVEKLDQAPPLGDHHHYARLAIWDADKGTVTDCRPKPGAGCCTFVVRPGENIQEAIDALPPAGGCVCLKAGLHPITVPIVIRGDNVTLHGESLGAIVDNPVGSSLLKILAGAEHVRVHTIVFRQIEAVAAPAILVMFAEDVVIDDCRLETADSGDSIGVRVDGSVDVTISGCAFRWQALGVWFDGWCRGVTVSRCEFMLAREIGQVPANAAILARTMSGPVIAEGNSIDGMGDGIIVNDDPNGRPSSGAEGSRIWGNRLTLHDQGGEQSQILYGIDVAARGSSVGDNRIDHHGRGIVAIRLGGSGSSACGNLIRIAQGGSKSSIAIVVGYFGGDDDLSALERVVVADNIVEGSQSGILLVGTARSRVAGNLLGENSGTTFGVALLFSPDCSVTDNSVEGAQFGILCLVGARSAVCGNRVDRGDLGVIVLAEQAPTVSGNRLTDLDQGGILIVGTTERCNVIENRVLRCGGGADIAFGLRALFIAGELHVESNEITDTGHADGGGRAPLAYGIVGDVIWEARIENNFVTYNDTTQLQVEYRALRLIGFLDIPFGDSGFGNAVQITNNKFIGPGVSALVELWSLPFPEDFFLRFAWVQFHGNYCMHHVEPPPGVGAAPRLRSQATVSLVGRHCSVTGNHVKALINGYPSYNLHDMPGPFIANASHSGHSGRATQKPNPEKDFNTIV